MMSWIVEVGESPVALLDSLSSRCGAGRRSSGTAARPPHCPGSDERSR